MDTHEIHETSTEEREQEHIAVSSQKEHVPGTISAGSKKMKGYYYKDSESPPVKRLYERHLGLNVIFGILFGSIAVLRCYTGRAEFNRSAILTCLVDSSMLVLVCVLPQFMIRRYFLSRKGRGVGLEEYIWAGAIVLDDYAALLMINTENIVIVIIPAMLLFFIGKLGLERMKSGTVEVSSSVRDHDGVEQQNIKEEKTNSSHKLELFEFVSYLLQLSLVALTQYKGHQGFTPVLSDFSLFLCSALGALGVMLSSPLARVNSREVSVQVLPVLHKTCTVVLFIAAHAMTAEWLGDDMIYVCLPELIVVLVWFTICFGTSLKIEETHRFGESMSFSSFMVSSVLGLVAILAGLILTSLNANDSNMRASWITWPFWISASSSASSKFHVWLLHGWPGSSSESSNKLIRLLNVASTVGYSTAATLCFCMMVTDPMILYEAISSFQHKAIAAVVTIILLLSSVIWWYEHHRHHRGFIAFFIAAVVPSFPNDEPHQHTNKGNRPIAGDSRGSIACFATCWPPLPLDIYCHRSYVQLLLTDGKSSNHSCRAIPVAALQELLCFIGNTNPNLTSYLPEDAAKGVVTGLVFVSERDKGLDTLHVALCSGKRKPRVLSLADIYGDDTFSGARLEDSGCFAGGFMVGRRAVQWSIVYVSTKAPASKRRSPWTAVYKTNLVNGKTQRLTPPGQYDMSPAVSPSGKMVAVANFRSNEWNGEIEHLKTDIVIMNVDTEAQGGNRRQVIIMDAGWPTWGSEVVIFFHRGVEEIVDDGKVKITWGVFRYDMSAGTTVRVTPQSFDAMTPAAISETKVAVATIRQTSMQAGLTAPRVEAQYRHIEIFDVTALDRPPVEITRKSIPKADHYSPFVLDGGSLIGFHRCRTGKFVKDENAISNNLHKLQSPESHKDVGLFRVSGAFSAISTDGSKLAFVENELKVVWLADGDGLRIVYGDNKRGSSSKVFSMAWNQNTDKDTLYMCVGPAFNIAEPMEIYAIKNASAADASARVSRLTTGNFNNAFPSSNPDGTKFVFRSSRPGGKRQCRNLFIMEDADVGEFGDGRVTQLTYGEWTDTQCSWSPQGDWIVFSSDRDKPAAAKDLEHGYFAVYMVKATDPTVVVRVIRSGATLAGHVNHPSFSPDMRSIVFTSDLAAVSVEPISLPVFLPSIRPYGDIFSVNLRVFNPKEDIAMNKDIEEFHRITHSRYGYSMPTWARTARFADVVDDTNTQSKLWIIGRLAEQAGPFRKTMWYVQAGGQSWDTM